MKIKFRLRLIFDVLVKIRPPKIAMRLVRGGIFASMIVLLTFAKNGNRDARPLSSEAVTFSCTFTYLQPGENIPQLDPELLSLTSRNPVARIYNKVANLARLQRELNGLSPIPLIQLRPTSMNLECPSNVSEESTLRRIETDLDINMARLGKMLADNPATETLAYAH